MNLFIVFVYFTQNPHETGIKKQAYGSIGYPRMKKIESENQLSNIKFLQIFAYLYINF